MEFMSLVKIHAIMAETNLGLAMEDEGDRFGASVVEALVMEGLLDNQNPTNLLKRDSK